MKPILLVGEARGEAEARMNSCFVGPSGAELLRMLNNAIKTKYHICTCILSSGKDLCTSKNLVTRYDHTGSCSNYNSV